MAFDCLDFFDIVIFKRKFSRLFSPTSHCLASEKYSAFEWPGESDRPTLTESSLPQESIGTIGPVTYHSRLTSADCCLAIAHAGGAIGETGMTYSNSRIALNDNYAIGRRVFEIDMIPSCDGHMVIAHDWKKRQRPPSRDEFLADTSFGAGETMDFYALVGWILRHPDTRVITDIK